VKDGASAVKDGASGVNGASGVKDRASGVNKGVPIPAVPRGISAVPSPPPSGMCVGSPDNAQPPLVWLLGAAPTPTGIAAGEAPLGIAIGEAPPGIATGEVPPGIAPVSAAGVAAFASTQSIVSRSYRRRNSAMSISGAPGG